MNKPTRRNDRRHGLYSLFFSLLLMVFFSAPVIARDYAQATVEKLAIATTNYVGLPLEYPRNGTPEVTALIVHLPPGSSTGWHKHPVPVYAWMIDGELTIRTENGIEKRIMKGEPIIEVMNILHNGTNTGKKTASLVVFYTGLKDVPNVIRSDAPGAGTENSR